MIRTVDITADWDGSQTTPIVRVCPDCTADQIIVPDSAHPPETYGEATAIVRCCGTADQGEWRYCFHMFAVTWPKQRKRVSFDKRVTSLPVRLDRRRAVPPPFPPRKDGDDKK